VGASRKFVVNGGGVLAADSPLAVLDICHLLAQCDVRAALTGYLGERPALSAKKTTLRRVPPDTGSDWHQDGAFLGRGVRSVNVWLSLSHCGVDAPGLDIVPTRLDLVETGTEGAIFDWSVGRPVVERAAGDSGISRPVFAPGDALLFDDRLLHSTATDPSMTQDRYALESWFFAPSSYPVDQVPVLF
jgi:ectoine hydroxylase-related dioxygenase (phytanoyl-CoA dioxygenase family)